MIISFNIDLDHSAHKGFFSWYNKITLNGKKKFLQRLILVKKFFANSDAENKRFKLRINCPSSSTKIRWSAPNADGSAWFAKQEIDLIHCQSNDSRPTYREQYTINDTANRRKLWVKSVDQVLLWHHSEQRDSCRDLFWWKNSCK